MLRKELILIFLSLWLLACGNSGNLYLSDEARINKTQDAVEIARLQERAQRFNRLKKTSSRLKIESAKLQKQGQKEAANVKHTAYKEAQYDMGQITLQRQEESKHGNI